MLKVLERMRRALKLSVCVCVVGGGGADIDMKTGNRGALSK